jgi:dTMP kinase
MPTPPASSPDFEPPIGSSDSPPAGPSASPSGGLPPALAAALSGRFIVFDGPDGSGKSTQLRRFVKAARDAGQTVCEVREPGGTEVGERIRAALLDHLENEDMDTRCEMLLYMASRAQLCTTRIGPALKRGELVVADRFVSSTLAYQGTAGGLDPDDIRAVARIATAGVSPDVTVIFDVDENTAASRLNPLLDRMESKGRAFHARVRAGYLDQIAADPKAHLRIDAAPAPEVVWADLLLQLTTRFAGTASEAAQRVTA